MRYDRNMASCYSRVLLIFFAFLTLLPCWTRGSSLIQLSDDETLRAQVTSRTLICSFHKHSSSWTDSDFDRFIGSLYLTPPCVASLDKHQLEWSNTKYKGRASTLLLYLNSIGDKIKNKQIWAVCTSKDRALWNIAIDQISKLSVTSTTHSFDDLARSCGAEDHNLDVLRRIDPVTLNPFIVSVTLSPHMAIGLLKLRKGCNFDRMVFGEDEAISRSPWHLCWYLLSPGTLSARYFYEFWDTNPKESTMCMFICLISDLAFWVDVAIFLYYKQKYFAIKSFLFRNLYALRFILFVYILNLYIFLPFMGSSTKWSILIELFLLKYSLDSVYSTIDQILKAEKESKAITQVAVPEKLKNMMDEVERLKESELFSSLIYDNQYSKSSLIASGGFGEVWQGKKIATSECVATKFPLVSTDANIEMSQLLGRIFKGICDDKNNVDEADETCKHALQYLQYVEGDNLLNIKHEILVLRAISILNHRHLLKFYDAFNISNSANMGNKYVLVMELAEPLLQVKGKHLFKWNERIALFHDKSLDLSEMMRRKLSIVQTFFAAIAALHESGITHRDVKLSNLSVRADSMDEALVIDMGSCYLPGYNIDYAEKVQRDVNTMRYIPQEQIQRKARSEVQSEIKRHKSEEKAVEYHNNLKDSYDLFPHFYKIYTHNKCAKMNHNDFEEWAKVVSQNFRGPAGDVFACAMTAVQILTDSPFGITNIDPDEFPYVFFDESFETYASVSFNFKDWGDSVMQNSNFMAPYIVCCGKEWNIDTHNKIVDRMLHNFISKRNRGYLDHSLIVLLKDMLHPDKSKRPFMRAAADHSYFKRNKIGTFREGYNDCRSTSGGTCTGGRGIREGSDSPTSSTSSLPKSSRGDGNHSPRFEPSQRVLLLRKFIADANAKMKVKMTTDDGSKLVSDIVRYFHSSKKCALSLDQIQDVFTKVTNLSAIFPALNPSDIFNFLDANGDGSIDKCELFTGLSFLLTFATDEKFRLSLLFHAFDTDGNGYISVDEYGSLLALFVANWTSNPHSIKDYPIFKEGSREISLDEFIDNIDNNADLKRLFVGSCDK